MHGSKVLRESGRWQEWEAGNGAIFYVCQIANPISGEIDPPYGGQWNKPRVFEIEDSQTKHRSESSSATRILNDTKVMKPTILRQNEIISLCKFFV
jgi:hypothetical protein